MQAPGKSPPNLDEGCWKWGSAEGLKKAKHSLSATFTLHHDQAKLHIVEPSGLYPRYL